MVRAPWSSDRLSSYSADRSKSVTEPMPSQRGHMPPRRVKVAFSVLVFPAPRSTVIAPLAFTDGTLNEYALGKPICGCPSRLNRMRSIALASVAVPTVERGLAPIRSWSRMIAVVSPSRTSTSGRASVGMKPWTKALYVSLISRCDSAAIVSNTSELLPEPETPVNTVSRRFGISTLMSLRLFSRAPCTRIRPWMSATCRAGNCVSIIVTMLIKSPSVRRSRLRGLRSLTPVTVSWRTWRVSPLLERSRLGDEAQPVRAVLPLPTPVLPARQLDDLNEVAAGVVQHCDGRAGHVGRRHRELGAARFDALVFALDVVGVEHGRRLALREYGLLVGFGRRIVVERELHLGSVRLFGRGHGQPAKRPLAEIG